MVRMLMPAVVEDALVELDEVKRRVFEETLGETISDLRWVVAKAPSNGIGIGIRDPSVTAAAQHLGSLGGAARALARLAEVHRMEGREQMATKFEAVLKAIGAKPGLSGLVTQLRQIAVDVDIPEKTINIPPATEIQSMPCTSYLAEFLHTQKEKEILSSHLWTKSELAGLQSGAQEGAGLWLEIIPAIPCFRVASDVHRAMVKTRLQMPMKALQCLRKCGCGKESIDFRHLTSSCPRRNKYIGHNKVTDVIRKMYCQLEMPVMHEPTGMVWGTEKRPADLLVLVPSLLSSGDGLPSALDVGIADAGTENALARGAWRVPSGALKAAEVYEKRKVVKFEAVKALNPPLGFEYRPIVFEASSARGPAAAAWWREITSLAKDKESGFGLGYGSLMEYNGLAHAWSGQTFARHWGMRLSLALVQSLHRYGLGKISEYTLEHGRRRLGVR